MTKIESVIFLVNSLSKAEKKHVSIQLNKGGVDKDYFIVYNLLIKTKTAEASVIKDQFFKLRPKGSFDIAVLYLYDKLLDILLDLRKKKDLYYELYQNINKSRMLYDRSMFYECFDLLDATVKQAQYYENYEVALVASKMKLEYLLRLDFPNMSEQEVYHIHYQQTDALKKIRKITEQASLFSLLKYRLIHRGAMRTDKQRQEMNDLMVSEMYIAASTDDNNFEITKNHQLFQAYYLINAGDYNAALHSFKALNKLFENNPKFWADPPIYYLSALEGVLKSLRTTGNYSEMNYFVEKLRGISAHQSQEFKVNVLNLIFQYKLFPYLDSGDFDKCVEIVNRYKDSLFDKVSLLSPVHYSELSLYVALVRIGKKDYKEARKVINTAMYDSNIEYLPIMRTIRLVRLMVYYELGDFDMIEYETRSIRRMLSSKKEHSFQTEHNMLWFLNKRDLPLFSNERLTFWDKIAPVFNDLLKDRYESQLLHLFDFTAWIESKVLKIDLSKVLKEHFDAHIIK